MSINLYQYGDKKCYAVHLPTCILYFSYDTLIGFKCNGNTYVTSTNWSRTTQRHMSHMGLREKNMHVLKEDHFQRIVKEHMIDPEYAASRIAHSFREEV